MNQDIPPLRRPELTAPIHTSQDMERHWRALMGELGFSQRLLWWVFIQANGRVQPWVGQVSELPVEPEARLLHNLLDACAQVMSSARLIDGSAGFLLSRPGSAQMTEPDRAWARGLVAAAAEAEVRQQPTHLATDEDVRVFAPDDLVVPART